MKILLLSIHHKKITSNASTSECMFIFDKRFLGRKVFIKSLKLIEIDENCLVSRVPA